MGSTITVRGSSSRRMAVVSWLACAVIAVTIVVNGGPAEFAGYGAVPIAAAALVWAVFWEPYVRVDGDGVRLANVWRTRDIPWSALESVDVRWGLRLTADGKRYSSWAVPARSRYRRSDHASPPPDLLEIPDGATRTVAADSEQIGRVIETRLLGGATSGHEQVRTTPNTRAIVIVGGALLLAVLTVLVLG